MNIKMTKKIGIFRLAIISILITIIIVEGLLIYRSNTNQDNKFSNASITNESSTSSTSRNVDTAVLIDVSKVTSKPEDDTERSSKIEILDKFYYHKETSKFSSFRVVGKNNNDHFISATFYLNFYKNGQRVNSEIGSVVNVKANKKFVVDISVDYADDYDSVDITYTSQKGKSVYTDLDISKDLFVFEEKSLYSSKQIYYNYNVDNKDKKVLYAYVIYYKDGKAVFAENAIYMDNGFRFFPSNYNVDYDEIEFDVYSAYLKSDSY